MLAPTSLLTDEPLRTTTSGPWPNVTQVEAAKDDAARLATWCRTLPSADTAERHEILHRILQYLPAAVRQERQRLGTRDS
jgi:hypothetical protein